MQSRSSNSVRITYAPSKKRIDGELSSYIGRLLSEIDLKLAVLFGSYAENKFGWGSDVDVLLVATDMPENWSDRYRLLMDPDFPVELQPFGYTTGEFSRMLQLGHPLILSVLTRGEVLHAIPEFRPDLLLKGLLL